jgi:hypothetical protein
MIGQNHQAWPALAVSAGTFARAGDIHMVNETRPMNIMIHNLPVIRISSS